MNPVLGDRFLGNAPARKTENAETESPQKKRKKRKKRNEKNGKNGKFGKFGKRPKKLQKHQICLFFQCLVVGGELKKGVGTAKKEILRKFCRNCTERRCSSSGRSPLRGAPLMKDWHGGVSPPNTAVRAEAWCASKFVYCCLDCSSA